MRYALPFLGFMLWLISISPVQAAETVPMADLLRSSGKIYVVVAVMCLVFIGIVFYLFTIDKRLKKIEASIAPED